MRTIISIFLIIIIETVQCLDLEWFYTFLAKDVSNNPNCNVQKQAFLKGIENREKWALKSEYKKQTLLKNSI